MDNKATPAATGPERVDESSHMPRAVCKDGLVLALIPTHLDRRHDHAEILAFVREVASRHGLVLEDVELLTICHRHPASSAVDCLDCEPLDAETR